ncbi:helix-turn-helix domain-containing protein [Roseateles chitosanitabidus]|jgi:putative transcriptional regulator|uniref:helix-turn-helix domain-containing protein n=1 Tax=Roseateles chitosanitabidus TaxID=65048 RepID=UPI000835695A|nr:transcriptional regulator [Roseateles chitosanitabidus]MBO9686073.1 transcriptional regulator [Roseateles chitosanitabidus]
MTRKRKKKLLTMIHTWSREFPPYRLMTAEEKRALDERFPIPTPLTAQEIREIRESMGIEQCILARLLVLPERLIRRWENGLSRPPGGAALQLLHMARRGGIEAISLYP